MADKKREFRWGVLIVVSVVGLIIWAIIPKLFWYIIVGLLLMAGTIAYLIYRKKGIQPLKIFVKASYGWLTEEKSQKTQETTQASIQEKQPNKVELMQIPPMSPEKRQQSKTIILKVPPLSASERAKLIDEVAYKCENPNCQEKLALEVHHVTPRAEGGANKWSNLIVLCANCHTKFQGGIYNKEQLKLWISKRRRSRFRDDLA